MTGDSTPATVTALTSGDMLKPLASAASPGLAAKSVDPSTGYKVNMSSFKFEVDFFSFPSRSLLYLPLYPSSHMIC